MATEQYLWDYTFTAEQDLSAKQYHMMELSSAGIVDTCDGAGDIVVGVLQNDPKAGEAAQVRILGVSKVVASGVIAAGAQVGTHTNGRAITKSANNDIIVGQALDASTADGQVIRVLMTGKYYFGA